MYTDHFPWFRFFCISSLWLPASWHLRVASLSPLLSPLSPLIPLFRLCPYGSGARRGAALKVGVNWWRSDSPWAEFHQSEFQIRARDNARSQSNLLAFYCRLSVCPLPFPTTLKLDIKWEIKSAPIGLQANIMQDGGHARSPCSIKCPINIYGQWAKSCEWESRQDLITGKNVDCFLCSPLLFLGGVLAKYVVALH